MERQLERLAGWQAWSGGDAVSENTKIEWCDHTWNPWRGCTKVSPGCANCYAERLSKRNPAVFGKWGKGKPRVLAKSWNNPVRWNRKIESKIFAWDLLKEIHGPSDAFLKWEGFISPRKETVFPSLCDWLDDEVPIKWLERFIELIHKTQNLKWLLLTKRPENFVSRLREVQRHMTVDPLDIVDRIDAWISGDRVPQNVWVGTSVEDQQRADERIPKLLKIPAKLRFLSVEPLLGPVEFERVPREGCSTSDFREKWMDGIEWVIIGGESGPRSRPCNVTWVKSIVRQCAAVEVPCFVKQLGRFVDIDDCDDPTGFSRTCESDKDGRWYAELNHPKGGDPAEWPEGLRVRQFPEVAP